MNPISAINAYVQPNGLISLLPKTSLTAPIPAAEMQQLAASASLASPAPIQPTDAGSFAGMLGTMVNEVSAKQTVANQAVTGLLGGQNVALHDTMIAMEEANVSFQLMVEVRNKLLESYQELMRMQI